MTYDVDLARTVFNFLIEKGYKYETTIGIMANLYCESGFRPNNLQNSANKKLNLTDEEYTSMVDSREYDNFVHDSAGYGLAQWTYWSRKLELMSFCLAQGASIGSMSAQLNFLHYELGKKFKKVIETMNKCNDCETAAINFMIGFEKPKNQSEANQRVRAGYATELAKRFPKKSGGTFMIKRDEIVNKAKSYVGLTENPKNSNNIIFNTDYYGHPVSGKQYPYCCVGIWDIYRMCNASKYFFGGNKTASCTTLLNYYKKNKPSSVKSKKDMSSLKHGDIVFFQFDTDIYADHVGIFLEKIDSTHFTTVEFNTSSGTSGSQDDGDGVYIRHRNINQVMNFVHITFEDDPETLYSKQDFINEVCSITETSNAEDAFKKTVTIKRKKSGSKYIYTNQTHPLVLPLQKMFTSLGYDVKGIDGCAGPGFFSVVNEYELEILGMKKCDNEVTAKGSIWKKFLL